MRKIKIIGGKNLNGTIRCQGAKNEALQIICASLLTKEEVILSNVPDIIDISHLLEIIKEMGCEVLKLGPNKFSINSRNVDIQKINNPEILEKCAKIRGSVMLLGPLLTRFGEAKIPNPGGDKIGRRKLDTHFEGFIKLGAKYSYNHKENLHEFSCSTLKGSYLWLKEASVTGTANLIMCSALTQGKTTIYNAACEPYIQRLCEMLIRMGGNISGIGTNKLEIRGVAKLKGCQHRISPDMIEIGSWIGLAAVTNSEIQISNTEGADLGIMPYYFNLLGVNFIQNQEKILIPRNQKMIISDSFGDKLPVISDGPWPGLTPDIISILVVIAAHCSGTVLIFQKMFESRLFFTDKLIEMGCKIVLCDPHRVVIIGDKTPNNLKGSNLNSPDIRAGMALLLASLAANGTSVISNAHQIERGYENIVERLASIGARISWE